MLSDITTVRDALHNLSPKTGGNSEYARGVLVGVVSGLMASGMTWKVAIEICSRNAPKRIQAGSVPHSWFGAFGLDDSVLNTNSRVWERKEGTV